MNHILQNGLVMVGELTVIAYVGFAAHLGITSVLEGRRLKAARAALRARRAPLTESEIAAVDFDAELSKLTKEDGR
jgi:hypothetical protein